MSDKESIEAETDLWTPAMFKELVELAMRPGKLACGEGSLDCAEVARLFESLEIVSLLQPLAIGFGAGTGGGCGDIVTTASLFDIVTDILDCEEVFSLLKDLLSSVVALR